MATLTKNQNYLQPTGFKVVIDRENYPNLEFFAQSVNHPDTNLGAPAMPFKGIDNIALPGDTISYSELSISFILDEDIKSYTEIYAWLERLVNEEHVNEGPRSSRSGSRPPSQADISVSILTSHSNQTKRVLYKGCTPTSLSGLELTSIASSVEYLTFNVSFAFTGFEFKG
jgi:hypothetical protein